MKPAINSDTFVGRIALHRDDANVLYEIASLGKTYIEIGTLFGGSACIAGLAGCEVFCIDPLDGYYSAKNEDPLRLDSRTGLVASEEIVRGNWERLGLAPEMLHIYKQLHPPWPEEIDRAFDVGLIDGDHTREGVMNDYLGMGPRVEYLMFHDINKAAVNSAWHKALRDGWSVYAPRNKPYWMGVLVWREQ